MNIQGIIDRVENSRLKGWAYDPSQPEHPVQLEVFHDGRLVGEISANIFRDDLLHAGIGDGKHAFEFVIPKDLLGKEENLLTVQAVGGANELPGIRPFIDLRKQISQTYIKGRGLEIGALHNPLWTSEHAHVSYVDRMTVEDLYKHYAELKQFDLVPVSVVDDGEALSTVAPGSQDFIIVNHFLEHCENPLGTLRVHLSKLRIGGVLFCTIPDMRFFLDREREVTTFEHFVTDDKAGPEGSSFEHYQDWARLWQGAPADGVDAMALELQAAKYSIHFHCWTNSSFLDFLLKTQEYLGNCFEIELVQFNYTEVIAVLRRTL